MIEANPPYIRTTSDLINPQTESLELLFSRLENELKISQVPGVGLAAVQLGIFKRAAIIRTKETTLNLWNPQIIESIGKRVTTEGCLSFPGQSRTISRFEQITIGNGDGRKYVLYGFDAIVVQHELDHLDGIVIVDKPHVSNKIGRNQLCPCGSRKKYKKCCLK